MNFNPQAAFSGQLACSSKSPDYGFPTYPALAGNRAVTMGQASNLVQIVLNGGRAPATEDNPRPFGMPPFVLVLNDTDMALVLTHVRQSWGNRASEITPVGGEPDSGEYGALGAGSWSRGYSLRGALIGSSTVFQGFISVVPARLGVAIRAYFVNPWKIRTSLRGRPNEDHCRYA